MKSIVSYLLEDYEYSSTLSESGNEQIKEFLDNLTSKLNSVKLPISKEFKKFYPGDDDPGVFVYDTREITNAKYRGVVVNLKSKQIFGRDGTKAVNPQLVNIAVKSLFGKDPKLYESLLDDDDQVLMRSKEYTDVFKYFKNVHDILSDAFNRSKILNNEYIPGVNVSKRDLGNKRYVTTSYKDIYVQFLSIYISNDGSVNITLIVYEDKGSDTLNGEKFQRQQKQTETR